MADVSYGYGRCIEGWQRADQAIRRRLRALRLAGVTATELDEDLELMTLYADRAAWERLMRETPRFVGRDHG